MYSVIVHLASVSRWLWTSRMVDSRLDDAVAFSRNGIGRYTKRGEVYEYQVDDCGILCWSKLYDDSNA